MKRKVIDTTLEEYTKDILLQCEKENIKVTSEDFRQSYYDDICNAIKNDIDISERVYNSIPDLHYWIYKHFQSRGYKVVQLDWKVQSEYFDVVERKAQ